MNRPNRDYSQAPHRVLDYTASTWALTSGPSEPGIYLANDSEAGHR